MIKIIGLFLLVHAGTCLQAQTFAEFFEQKKTQIKYLEEQVAALEAYMKVTEAGYKIVKEGTNVITAIKKGDFDLHSGYFASLRSVNPSLSSYPKVNAILSLNDQIIAISGQARQLAEGTGGMGAQAPPIPEAGTVSAFYDGMLKDCDDDLTILQMLTTTGQVQMTDDERMQAIDRMYDRMKKRYADAIRARNDVAIMSINQAL
jgi:hypothetical protein